MSPSCLFPWERISFSKAGGQTQNRLLFSWNPATARQVIYLIFGFSCQLFIFFWRRLFRRTCLLKCFFPELEHHSSNRRYSLRSRKVSIKHQMMYFKRITSIAGFRRWKCPTRKSGNWRIVYKIIMLMRFARTHQMKNKTQYFRLRLYWLLFWSLSECWLIPDWLLEDLSQNYEDWEL